MLPEAQTPFRLGCDEYPLREEAIRPLCQGDELRRRTRVWRGKYGRRVPEPAKPFDAPPPSAPTCAGHYGVGKCKRRLSDDLRAKIDHNRAALLKACRHRNKETSLQLLCIRPLEAEAADAAPELFCFMCVFGLLSDPEALRQ